MKQTNKQDLLLVAIAGAVVGLGGFSLFYGDLPGVPLPAGVPLGVLAVVEALFGYGLRSRIQGRPGKPVQALSAARAVALAKASSVLGSLMTGVWVGALVYLLPKRDRITAAADDVPGAVIAAVCAALLVAAALWLEHCCRTPDDPYTDDKRSTT
ncbi:DUF3180 domain-containing protein [Actinokineospora sp. G85]|uniref:DUF3180 domain-containing protein n=1 Tax=Actinokineospora sp. G85 TaxID=3406626 RepID=UPI003C726514